MNSPFSTHGTHEIVSPSFRLGKDESLVFLLLHNFLHELRQLPVLLVVGANVGDLNSGHMILVISSLTLAVKEHDGNLALTHKPLWSPIAYTCI